MAKSPRNASSCGTLAGCVPAGDTDSDLAIGGQGAAQPPPRFNVEPCCVSRPIASSRRPAPDGAPTCAACATCLTRAPCRGSQLRSTHCSPGRCCNTCQSAGGQAWAQRVDGMGLSRPGFDRGSHPASRQAASADSSEAQTPPRSTGTGCPSSPPHSNSRSESNARQARTAAPNAHGRRIIGRILNQIPRRLAWAALHRV